MKKSFLAIVLTLAMLLSIPVSAESLSEFFSVFPIPSSMEMEVKANVQVKKASSQLYVDGPINVKKITSEKVWPKFDFQATMYMSSVRSAFKNYTGISKALIADDAQLLAEFNNLPVYGGFTVSVTYPSSIIIPEAFLTAGEMEGFNESAKSVFKEISREEISEGQWKTLSIEISVKSPDGTADFVKQKELADNLDKYLPDFTLTCEDVATSAYGTFPVYGSVEGFTNIGSNTEEGRITVLSYEAVPQGDKEALGATVRVVRDNSVQYEDDTVGGGVIYPTGGGADEVIVSFDVAGETILVDPVISDGKTVVNLDTVQKPKREGYIFDGWYSDAAFKTPMRGTVEVDKDTAFFGRWISTKAPEILNAEEHVAYINGYEDGTIRPENAITREEIAMLLYRLLDAEYRSTVLGARAYADVAGDRWSFEAISAMSNAGIIKGYPEGTFQPSKAITRAEFATMINRLYGEELLLSGIGFYDAAGHWAEENIISAACRGIVTGYEDGTFRPDANVTRAEAVTILNRILVRHVDAEGIYDDAKVWPDNALTAWYYYDMMEASISHAYTRRDNGVFENWIQ